jgi:hypothetical protein
LNILWGCDGRSRDNALEAFIVVIASLGEVEVLCLRLACVVEDDLLGLGGRRVVLLRAVPCPFPDFVAIGSRA